MSLSALLLGYSTYKQQEKGKPEKIIIPKDKEVVLDRISEQFIPIVTFFHRIDTYYDSRYGIDDLWLTRDILLQDRKTGEFSHSIKYEESWSESSEVGVNYSLKLFKCVNPWILPKINGSRFLSENKDYFGKFKKDSVNIESLNCGSSHLRSNYTVFHNYREGSRYNALNGFFEFYLMANSKYLTLWKVNRTSQRYATESWLEVIEQKIDEVSFYNWKKKMNEKQIDEINPFAGMAPI